MDSPEFAPGATLREVKLMSPSKFHSMVFVAALAVSASIMARAQSADVSGVAAERAWDATRSRSPAIEPASRGLVRDDRAVVGASIAPLVVGGEASDPTDAESEPGTLASKGRDCCSACGGQIISGGCTVETDPCFRRCEYAKSARPVVKPRKAEACCASCGGDWISGDCTIGTTACTKKCMAK